MVIIDFFVVLVILMIVVFGFLKLEFSFRFFCFLGVVFLGILIVMFLSNVGIFFGKLFVYDFLYGIGVSFGIVFILFSVDIWFILRVGFSMLVVFGIGVLGSVVGGICFVFVFYSDIGEEIWKLIGQFIGIYMGGGMNFVVFG